MHCWLKWLMLVHTTAWLRRTLQGSWQLYRPDIWLQCCVPTLIIPARNVRVVNFYSTTNTGQFTLINLAKLNQCAKLSMIVTTSWSESIHRNHIRTIGYHDVTIAAAHISVTSQQLKCLHSEIVSGLAVYEWNYFIKVHKKIHFANKQCNFSMVNIIRW